MRKYFIVRSWVVGLVVMVMLAAGTTASAQFGNTDNAPARTGRGYEVSVNNPVFLILPGMNEAPAPDWVKPGVRLTFFNVVAMVPKGDIADMLPDERGRWIDPNTGKTFSVQKNKGSYDEGYMQLDVLSLPGDAVAVAARGYSKDLMDGSIKPIFSGGFVALPGAGEDWWVNPDVLNQTVDHLQGPVVQSLRLREQAAGNEYDAVWINTKTEGGYASRTYDLDSGLTLNLRSSNTTKPDGMVNLNGEQLRVGGAAYLTEAKFVGMRQVNVPWIGMPMPRTMEGVRQLVYEGEMTSTMLGNTIGTPMRMVIDVTGRGPNFIQMKRTITFHPANGTPPPESVSRIVGGVNQLLPLCVPPKALAQLRNGQVIDKDPFTNVTTFVSFIGQDRSGNDVITLTEYINEKSVRYDVVYDANSGLMIASQLSVPQLNMQVTLYLVQ
ncbi:MAG: hypothetical protein IT446_12985 [Phycisphaerales bacterium]|nr:hypothetical protein [Phycisphaerales bacterium]